MESAVATLPSGMPLKESAIEQLLALQRIEASPNELHAIASTLARLAPGLPQQNASMRGTGS